MNHKLIWSICNLSFSGIMCWEIFHNGKEPYPGMRVPEVLAFVQQGQRMSFDASVHPDIQNMIVVM